MKKISLMLIALLSLPLALAVGKTPDRFDQADRNHDGMLSLDELNAFLVSEIFGPHDKNKDGKLTRAEWMEGSNDAAKGEAFRVRDANADGVVTMDEALAYGRKK